MKNNSWSGLSEYLVNLIGISDQLEWNNQASAAVFSLIETAKANRLDPYDYIEFILDYLPQ